ncbi:MAG: beta-lactamase family protein [Lachnospiraceae bacterium]|nr:beta-lactamase family protein [Lachnospiraceae bacterium]
MNRMTRKVMCIICCIMVIFGGQSACATAQTSLTETDLYSNIDEYLQKCVENANIPAMSVCIVDKNEELFSGTYGQCESSDTPFFLGSVSKSFTAVCIMQLAEQHKVDLAAAISTYLPDATDGDEITVSQLLNHTSGLGEHQTLENYKIVNKQGVHHYANVNYALLGEIIEAVSGKSYSEYISANLFEPLGLSHTAATLAESKENGLIDGYTNYWGIPVKTAHKYPSSKNDWITVPAGYLSSSSKDLGKYLQMYLNGGNGIISEESIHTMFYGDTVYVEDDIPFWYGYGWNTIKEPLSEPVLRHAGLIETGTSCIFIIPESGIGIAIEANINDYFVTNEMMDSIGWGVLLMLLGEPANGIADHSYAFKHLQIDLVLLLMLLLAILPLCFLPRYIHRTERKKLSVRITLLLLLHFLLPIFILLLVPIFFATPLWVAKAFVPDVYITVMISSALLFIGGLVKSIILYRHSRHGITP